MLLCWLAFASGATTTPFADVDSLVESFSSCCETGISLTASTDMAYVCVASPSLSHSRRRSEPAVEVEPCAASTSPGALALKRLDDLALDLVPALLLSVSPRPVVGSVVRSYPPLSPRSFGLEAGRRPRSLWDSSRNPVLGAPTAQRVKPEITFPVGNLCRKTRTSQRLQTWTSFLDLGAAGDWEQSIVELNGKSKARSRNTRSLGGGRNTHCQTFGIPTSRLKRLAFRHFSCRILHYHATHNPVEHLWREVLAPRLLGCGGRSSFWRRAEGAREGSLRFQRWAARSTSFWPRSLPVLCGRAFGLQVLSGHPHSGGERAQCRPHRLRTAPHCR